MASRFISFGGCVWKFGARWKLGFSAKNLLNSTEEAIQTYRGVDYTRYERTRGRSYSLSLGYGF